MHKTLINNFENQNYYRRLDICNSQFGFNFEGENLENQKISYDDFIERFKFLNKKYGKNIKDILSI